MPEQNVFGHLLPQQTPPPPGVPAGPPVPPGVIYGKPKALDPYQVSKDQVSQSNEARRLSLAEQAAAREQAKFDQDQADLNMAATPETIKAIAEGRIPMSARLVSTPKGQQILKAVTDYDPTFDAVDYSARLNTRKDFTSGNSAKNIKALNTAIGHVGQLYDQIGGTASHGGLPGATALNYVQNAINRSAGDPGVTNYEQTASAVASELTQVFRGSGGAEADVKRYLDELNSNASRAQKEAAVKNIAGLLNSRLEAISDQYRKGMGRAADGVHILDQHAQDVLGKIGVVGGHAPPGAPPSQLPPNDGSPPPPAGPPPGYEAKFNDEIPPPTAYRMSDANERAYLAFIESQKGNPGFTLDMANKFLNHLGEQPVTDNGFVKATQEGNVRTSGVDTSGADAAYKGKVDALAKQRDTIGGEVDAVARGAADMLTLGLADKISAGLNTIADGGTYADNLAKERLTDAADSQANPWVRVGGQIAGAMVLPMGEARGVGAMASKGAGYGAAYSGLSSDKPILDRGGDILGGAATGALGGVAGKAVEVAGAAAAPTLAKGANALLNVGRNGKAVEEVAQNANALAAGGRWDIPMRQPDIRPSTRADFAAAEASPGGNALVTNALESDKSLVRDAVSHVGGKGAPQDGFSVGESLQKTGKDYIVKSRAQANALYSRAEKLAGTAKAVPEEAASTLAENIADLRSNGANTNKGAIKYLEDLQSDIGSGPLSIDKLRSLRTNMRGQINERNLTSTDTERRVIQVLDAAARDIEKGLSDKPEALAAYKGADAYFRQKQDFIKQVVQTFTGTRNAPLSPENAAQRLMAMTKQGGDSQKFARIWSELEPAERGDIQATIAESFGAGRNGDFSLAALATNLRKVNPRTIEQVFGKDGVRALDDLREIAQAKTATSNALNKSRTAVVTQRNNTFKDLMLGVMGGGVGGVPGAIAGMAARGAAEKFSSRRMAKLLLNPDFTKWLKGVPATSDPKLINKSFEQLDKIVARSPSIRGDAKALQDFLGQAFAQSPTKAAAAENENSSGPPVPQN